MRLRQLERFVSCHTLREEGGFSRLAPHGTRSGHVPGGLAPRALCQAALSPAPRGCAGVLPGGCTRLLLAPVPAPCPRSVGLPAGPQGRKQAVSSTHRFPRASLTLPPLREVACSCQVVLNLTSGNGECCRVAWRPCPGWRPCKSPLTSSPSPGRCAPCGQERLLRALLGTLCRINAHVLVGPSVAEIMLQL